MAALQAGKRWARPQLSDPLVPTPRVDPQLMIQRLAIETDVDKRRAMLVLLGEFPDAALSESERQHLIGQLLAIFEKEPDPGLHGASQWLLRKWKYNTPWMPRSSVSERTKHSDVPPGPRPAKMVCKCTRSNIRYRRRQEAFRDGIA